MTAFLPLDLETTGLDPETGTILEIAWTVVENLSQIPTEPSAYITALTANALPLRRPINPFVNQMHTESGLWAELANPDVPKVPLLETEARIIKALELFEPPYHVFAQSPAGVDLPFIQHHMPRLSERLSHRSFDLRTIMFAAADEGLTIDVPDGEVAHRAADDIAWAGRYYKAYREARRG